jgi:cobalamin biosynthesis Mg chelatase CobN
VKRLAVLCLAALVLAGPVSAADAATPSTTACRNKIINEWEGTGRIKTTYPVACYTAALAYVKKQADLSTYSSIAQDIRAALLARKARAAGKTAPTFVGKPVKHTTTTSSTGTGAGPGGTGGAGGPGSGGSGGSGTTLSGTNDTGGSSGTPLPVIILGGVAIVLVAAGAIGTGIRHARRRGA